MNSFLLTRAKIREVCSRTDIDFEDFICNLQHHTGEYDDDKAEFYIELLTASKKFLQEFARTLPPNNKTYRHIALALTKDEEALDKTIHTWEDLCILTSSITGATPFLGVEVGKMKFPVCIYKTSVESGFIGTFIKIVYSFKYGEQSNNSAFLISQEMLETMKGKKLRDFLTETGFSILSKEEIEAHKKLIEKTQRIQQDWTGKPINFEGPVYIPPSWGRKLPIEIGLGKGKKRAIVEDELEVDGTMWYDDGGTANGIIPLVRVFLMEKKCYCYIPTEAISEYVFNKTGFKDVVMAEADRHVLEKVFTATADKTFGDIFGNRHGGTVILADGPPGVGKTLTAETFAEMSERPLYIADVSEIGVDVEYVEGNLKNILERAAKWNAVLLLDEADIFLVKRDVDNIERNAIVGTFLRFLDGFSGTLFLTTNRVSVIDPAFASRITLRMKFEALTPESRIEIWKKMLASSGIITTEAVLQILSTKTMNGRQIRNMVRLAKMVYESSSLDIVHFEQLEKHTLSVEEKW